MFLFPFSPPPSAPFHRTALSFPPPSPFPPAGAGGKGRWGGEKAWRGGGGAALRPHPRGPRPRGHRSPPPTPARPPLGAGSESCGPPSLSSAFARPILHKQSWGESALEVAVHPFLRGADSACDVGLLPWPQAGGGFFSPSFQRQGK